MVQRLKSFARLDESIKQITQINKDLETTMSLIHFPEDIQVKTDLTPVSPLYCSPVMLNQVWSNLLFNAIQAIEDTDHKGGEIVIKLMLSSVTMDVESKGKI